MSNRWCFAALVTAAAGIFGCNGQREPERIRIHVQSATLRRAQSCGELEQLLKQDALIKLNAHVDAQIRWARNARGKFGFDGNTSVSATSGGAQATGSADKGGGGAAPAHSDTNTQVKGVDEADIVKTDGKRMFALQQGTLYVLRSWPAAELSVLASKAIEGHGHELYLAGDRVVVYSTVDGKDIYQAAGIKPSNPSPEHEGAEYYYYPALTKTTVLAVDPTTHALAVVKEIYAEGQYQSSRRIGAKVRTIVNGGYHTVYHHYVWPNGSYSAAEDTLVAAWEQARAQSIAKIQATTLAELLPRQFSRSGAKLELTPPSCGDYYVPTNGTTNDGMVQVQTFDVEQLGAVHTTSVIGYASTIYSSADALYLAGDSWMNPLWEHAELGDDPVSVTATHLHKFDIATDPAKPVYRGSATIPGYVHDQFSLDEHEGALRIATTDQRMSRRTTWSWDRDGTTNHVFTIAEKNGALAQLGSVTDLAPGERVMSARFVGERGYLVTFRNIDPLFVIDLKNPGKPKVMAELKIPGFSSYMHPLDGGSHLLTIGRDGTADGQVLGTALQIFDVSDALHPKLVHKHVLSGDRWNSWSEAEHNHKAFTFYQGMLAIPRTSYEHSYPNHYGFQSSLELFDVDAKKGISARGSIDHTPLVQSYESDAKQCGYWGLQVRRGVFIGDYVFTLSQGGVMAHATANLSSPVATLPLAPAKPTSSSPCFYWGW